MFDAIIVGSGPAGTFCASELRGRNVLVVDVGFRPARIPDLGGNLYDLRRSRPDMFDDLIGSNFEGLHNTHRNNVSLKLKSPGTAYVIRDWEKLSPIVSSSFEGMMSFAQGGLANVWGAGVYRFNSADLEGFPLGAEELAPYYDSLTEHIGVSGTNDDLVPYFGADSGLMPPVRITRFAEDLLRQYEKKRQAFKVQGITMGLPRLAVLTRDHNGRAAYGYENLEFFKPYIPAIYNPAFTLNDLVERRLVQLKSGHLVSRYTEHADRVDVIATNLATGQDAVFSARSLFLAAGTLSTTKIVLTSNDDVESRLPILDNPMSCLPLFRPSRIGAALETNGSSLAQANLILEDGKTGEVLQASIYGTTGPLHSDTLFRLPLNVSAGLAWTKYLAPAAAVVMLFYPGKRDPTNYIRLTSDSKLEINYARTRTAAAEKKLLKAFRGIGYYGAMALCQYPPMGSSLHYAATLPMKEMPGRYETDRLGRLFGTKRIFVCDGSCFSALPAKNLTFTIMANAMRIARGARATIQ